MTTFNFSALSDGDSVSFRPGLDILSFDQSVISAADVRITASSTSTRVEVVGGQFVGKDIVLLNTTPYQLYSGNVTFASGSRLLVGDNSVNQNDNGANVLSGTVGRDAFYGYGGNDTMGGGDGADVFVMVAGTAASYGNDSINGGGGLDIADFSGASGAVSGNLLLVTGAGGSTAMSGVDGLIGSAFNDNLSTNNSANVLQGGAGNDTLTSNGGADRLIFAEAPGSAHADLVTDFASASDKLVLDGRAYSNSGPSGNFSAGDARFFAAPGATSGQDASDRLVYNTTTGDVFWDADGNGAGAAQRIATLQNRPALAATDIEVINAQSSSAAPIQGTAGNDSLTGTAGNDTIDGLGGNDGISGLGGDDSLIGGSGNDFVHGGDGNDTVVGGDGNDTNLEGNNGNDVMFGNAGDDNLNGGAGNDTMDGGAGNDGFGMVQFDFDRPVGGNDGNDSINGGDGFDDIGFSIEGVNSTGAVTIDLAAGTYRISSSLGTASGTAVGIEQVQGSWFNDSITGSGAANFLDGAGGNDSIRGAGGDDRLITHEGNDVLAGGTGKDALTSGTGSDRLVFAEAPGIANSDLITDFDSGSDQLVLDGTAHAGSGPSGNFSAGDARFFAAPGATSGQDASDRLIYDTATGDVYWDADGNGAGAAQPIAFLPGRVTLEATDIEIINGSSGGGQAPIQGTEGNDTLTGTAAGDTIDGRGGNDLISGLAGDDSIIGGAGNDTMSGSDGADLFVMMPSTVSSYGTDSINGGGGRDIVDFSGARSAVTGNLVSLTGGGENGTGSVAMGGVDGIIGGAFNDRLTGNGGSNQLLDGGAGNDTLDSASGTDTLIGGAGNDFYIVYGGETLSDSSGVDKVFSNTSWTLGAGFENLKLEGTGNLSGTGNGEDNHIVGNSGNNTLSGGQGRDTLEGGFGLDSYLFVNALGFGVDEINEFVSGSDRLLFDNAGFAALGAEGAFAANDARFAAGAGFTSGRDESDRLIFDSTTGGLYYDFDGSGPGGALLIADLQIGNPTLNATDITVI